MGMGDADLMMMAGAFLGWQPTVAAFFVSVVPALVFGVFQLVVRRTQELPFGPSLAVGCVTTLLCWKWIGPFLQPYFFLGGLVGFIAVAGAAFLFLAAVVLRVVRGGPQPEKSA